MALHPRRLIDLATRLPAYSGVVAARGRLDEAPPVEDGEVDSAPGVLMSDPVFGSMFDFGEVVE